MTLLDTDPIITSKIAQTCCLCSHELPSHPIRDGEKSFCCPGCHAVFNILSTKNQLVNFHDNPIFQQAVRSGLISNPALLDEIRRKQPTIPINELEKIYFEIAEMWCPACSELIKLILLQEKGIKNCVVDYATDLASVEFSPRYISKEHIYKLIQSLGYKIVSLDESKKSVSFSLYLRFAIAAFCSLNVMMFAYPLYATYFDFDDQGYGRLFAWISFFTSIPVVTYCFWPILRHFWTSCKIGLYGMEALVVIGVTTAFGLSLYNLFQDNTHVYFDSMTVIIAFMLLGKIIETRAKFSAKDSILRLAKSIPRRGRKRFSDGSQQFVLIKDIFPGDIIVATSGEKIVLDGVVIEGEGFCDESLMTGESLPVKKSAGDHLIGGTILQNGVIAFRVTSSAEQSTLQRILDMIQREIGRKTNYLRYADSIIQWFVPTVLLVAFTTAIISFLFGISDGEKTVFETALIRAVSVLLISCPCAIGIAAPLAESYILNALANVGAIVRNRGCLAFLGDETAFVFDKTGTITEGSFTVLNGLEILPTNLLKALKGLAQHSTHPISKAIAKYIETSLPVTEIEEFSGNGLKGIYEGKKLLLGSRSFLQENGIDISIQENNSSAIQSYVYVAYHHKLLTIIHLGDKIRTDAASMISSFHPTKTFLISGDNFSSVSSVASLCHFTDWKAECNPMEKKQFVDALKQNGYVVGMLGDGINDAPALTAADIGISVVTATDISIQVSDILLTTDRLDVIPKIRKLAKQGRKIVKQNLFWAFFYNVVGIAVAAIGLLSPIVAASAMVISSLMVTFNSTRIKKV